MTGPLAHFDSHILTNHSHITVGLLAHSMFTLTLSPDHSPLWGPLAHHCTRTLCPHHSHITVLAHYDRTTRTSLYSHIMTAPLAHFDSHIPCSLAHYDRTTRTFRLAHHRTRTFHVHSHIMTGPLAHSGVVNLLNNRTTSSCGT